MILNISTADYDATRKDFISASDLGIAIDDPALMWHFKLNPKEASDAMSFGTLFHKFVLEPERFKKEVTVVKGEGPINPNTGKPFNRNTKAWLEWMDTFNKDGGEVIFPDDHERIKAMKGSIMTNRVILGKSVISIPSTLFECAIQHPFDGVNVRSRLDIVNETARQVNDLKTTDNIEMFRKRLKFDEAMKVQAATYIQLAEVEFKTEFEFKYIVVETKAPYRSALFVVTQEWIEEAYLLLNRAVAMVKRLGQKSIYTEGEVAV